MTKNTGKAYEEFVGAIQQSLINAEQISHLKNINVEINKKIIDRNGIARQFDVYWEFKLGGYEYKSVIECKDYASSITIEKIDAFIGKTADIPGLKLIYATKTGYQSGTQKKAEQHKIDLLIVREADNDDWCAPDGTPLIKTIQLNIVAIFPPRITSFSPLVDAKWLESRKDLTVEYINSNFSRLLNNEIFIVDKTSNARYSLYDLANSLAGRIPDIQYGEGTYKEALDDAYLESENGELSIKLKGFSLTYIHSKPAETISTIDYSKDLLGIVQNYVSGTKKIVFKNGIIK
ncbi:restriction endonuclease [Enterobacter asburiae]|uniref:restriction endonuclease n=1 Tax=Enterobacter asburiae TaxID=61645 RepID=UPI00403E224E